MVGFPPRRGPDRRTTRPTGGLPHIPATVAGQTQRSEGSPPMADRTILDMFRLDGRVAIVTGASSGLGAVFARTLAEAGADVVLGARRVDRLAATQEAVEAAGRRALSVRTDVAQPEDCQALVAAAMTQFGRVDILVNNAGIGTATPATRETPEQFRSVIDVNLNG